MMVEWREPIGWNYLASAAKYICTLHTSFVYVYTFITYIVCICLYVHYIHRLYMSIYTLHTSFVYVYTYLTYVHRVYMSIHSLHTSCVCLYIHYIHRLYISIHWLKLFSLGGQTHTLNTSFVYVYSYIEINWRLQLISSVNTSLLGVLVFFRILPAS